MHIAFLKRETGANIDLRTAIVGGRAWRAQGSADRMFAREWVADARILTTFRRSGPILLDQADV